MAARNLTPEEREQVIEVRRFWMQNYGLSTEPANRPAAEEAVRQAYREAGLKPPQHYIWVDSPYAGSLALAIVPQAIDAALELVRQATLDHFEPFANKQMPPLQFQRDAVELWWRNASYGQHNADFYSYVDVARQLGAEGLDNVDGVLDVAKNAGWWWPAEEFCIITDRPEQLHWDVEGELHCETGPAILYRDGWGVHLWHGTRVPASLIETNWTVKQILDEPNLEVRRCAIEKKGWERIIIEGRFTPVGSPVADPGNPGHELVLFSLPPELGPEGESAKLLMCDNATPERDGTRRRFGITVPATVNTPLEAAAWTFGLSAEEYSALQRAC